MSRIVQRLAFALLTVLTVNAGYQPPASAAAATVHLHYTFKPGEILTYSTKSVSTTKTVTAGQPVDTDTTTVIYLSHYVVHSVDSVGNATMSIVADSGASTDVHNGKTTHKTVSPDQLTSPASACIQEVDGTQYCVYRGAYGLNDVGQLAAQPVSVGSTWTSTIDNYWVDNGKPISLSSKLTGIGTSASGGIAVVATTAKTSGTVTSKSSGKNSTLAVRMSESGTWSFGIDSGEFIAENLLQTLNGSGKVTDKQGSHATTLSERVSTTMRLIATKQGSATPLAKAYTTKTYSPAGAGYSLAYPSTWTPSVGQTGSFQIASAGDLSLIVGFTAPTKGSITSSAYVSGFLRDLGTPLGAVSNTLRSVKGVQYGIADAVLQLKGQPIEAQCEARVWPASGGTGVLIGIVSLGLPGINTRPPDLAQEYEQVQKSLNSVQLAASPV